MSEGGRNVKKDIAAAIFLILASAAIFYLWLIVPVFSGGSSKEGLTAVYRVYDARSDEKEYLLNFWRNEDGFVARREFPDRSETLIAYRNMLYSKDSTGNIELLERGLMPYFYPLDPVFGRFILEAGEELPGFRALGEVTLKGRRTRHLVFYSPFDSEKRHEVWIDLNTGAPLIYVEENKDGTVYSAELLSIKQIETPPDEFQPAPQTTAAVDRFAGSRVSPSSLQLRAGFQVLVPSVVPRRLEKSSFLVLSDPTIEMFGLKVNGKVVAISFYGEDGFLSVFEYRGKLPELKTDRVINEKIAGRNVQIVSGAGYRAVLIYEKPVSIVLLTDISYKEIKNAVGSMFE